MILSCPCHEAGLFRFVGMSEEQMENLKELSRHELLALKEIHLTGQASDKGLVRKFVDQGRGLLVRGSPSLWDIAR
jgi:hypothetical protein